MGGSPLFKKILRQCFGNLSETWDCVEGGAPLKYTSPVGEPAGQGVDPTAKNTQPGKAQINFGEPVGDAHVNKTKGALPAYQTNTTGKVSGSHLGIASRGEPLQENPHEG